jgi:hypothetical protein
MKVSRKQHVYAAVLVTSLSAFLAAGCQSYARHAETKPRRPAPTVESADAILRRQAVAQRSRELINEGKYTTTNDARRAAEEEIPAIAPTNTSAHADWQRYRRQVEAQEKFEADLAKTKRGS